MRSRNSAKNRRETNDFIGAQGVLKHLKDGPSRRRVGFVVDEVPARGMMAYKRCRASFLTPPFFFFLEGAEIFTSEGDLIGLFKRYMSVRTDILTCSIRQSDVGHSIAHIGHQHRNGICEEWVA